MIALLALAAWFVINMTQQQNARTDSVTGAASAVAGAAERTADNVGDAAGRAADSVERR